MSKANKRVAVIDAPKTRLSKSINGIQIINWTTHDPDAFNDFDVCPDELRRRIKKHYPQGPAGKNDRGGSGTADMHRFKYALSQNIKRRKDLTLDIIDKEQWDLLFTVFDDAHHIGHLTWHLHDNSHPGWSTKQSEKFGHPLEEIYIEIDRAASEIIAKVDKETTVIVFNNLGMGPNYHAKELVDSFLKSMDGSVQQTKKDREPLINS